ncbi:MAG: antitoxin VapB family protein [Candidatus Bathyarchaeia archaeon]
MKRPEESFSDVIKRLLKNKPKLLEITGSKTISIKDWENIIKAFRDRDRLDDVRRRYLLGLIGE